MLEQNTQVEDDFLSEVLPEGEVGAEIILEEPAQADYQIQKIAQLKRKQEELRNFVVDQMQKLETFLEKRTNVLQGEIDWRSQPLEVYIRDTHRKSDGKIKSLDLPHGKLKLKAQPDKFLYDDAKILAWANTHPAEDSDKFVVTKPRILHDQLKAVIKETGLSVDGVTIEPAGEPKFYLEIKK